MTRLREDREIPFADIVDPTRPLEAYPSAANPKDALADLADNYRKDLWHGAPFDVYLISEKETIMGVLAPVLEEYLVPYQVIHGYGSLSSAWRLAKVIEARRKHAWVLGIGLRSSAAPARYPFPMS